MNIQIYANGLVHCSVCAPKSMAREDLEKAVNLKNPTGINHAWKISNDATFKDGKNANPCQCEDDETRLHYLMVC